MNKRIFLFSLLLTATIHGPAMGAECPRAYTNTELGELLRGQFPGWVVVDSTRAGLQRVQSQGVGATLSGQTGEACHYNALPQAGPASASSVAPPVTLSASSSLRSAPGSSGHPQPSAPVTQTTPATNSASASSAGGKAVRFSDAPPAVRTFVKDFHAPVEAVTPELSPESEAERAQRKAHEEASRNNTQLNVQGQKSKAETRRELGLSRSPAPRSEEDQAAQRALDRQNEAAGQNALDFEQEW
ncbi:MAG: hypothetical protein C0514_07790 [Candidatus Puniceispirillum sp.]|nr:hypothetical protein [Candidatus Puniceispirillum sp.]